MHHIMIDLETLGTVAGCAILSIGAVEFHPDTGNLGKEFYTIVNTESCEEHFLTKSASTMAWWARQSPEAQLVLDQAAMGGPSLPTALSMFNAYLAEVGMPKELRLYGNGADFDNPILDVAYEAAKVKFYGDSGRGFFGGRCYRTLKNLDELFGPAFAAHKIHRVGTYHNALDDAKSQARHLMEFVSTIRGAFLEGVK